MWHLKKRKTVPKFVNKHEANQIKKHRANRTNMRIINNYIDEEKKKYNMSLGTTNLTRNDLSNSPKKNDDEGSQSETQSNQSFTSPPVKNKKRKTRTTGTGSRLLPAKNK